MIEFVGEFTVNPDHLKELKAMIANLEKMKKDPDSENYEGTYADYMDDVHKRFLEVFNGKFVKYGPFDWIYGMNPNFNFKKSCYHYVALKGFTATPVGPNISGYLGNNLPRIEIGRKYVLDYNESIHVSYYWDLFGVYNRANSSVQGHLFCERGKIEVRELTKAEFDEVYNRSFDTATLSETLSERREAREAAEGMAKNTDAFKKLNKEEKLLKDQIKFIKMRRDLLIQRQLLSNSRGAVAMDNRDNIPELLETSAQATIDMLNKEVEKFKEKLHKEGVNVF